MSTEPEATDGGDLPLEVEEAIERWTNAGAPPAAAEVDRLCGAHPAFASVLRRAAADLAEDAIDGQPRQVGPYRLLRRIGEGGMGTVFLAEQREPIRRRVAVKVVKLGMDSKSVLARFDAERQALALMEHSCIARVLDGGLTSKGQPWFAMEYVKGIPITDYCDQAKLDLAERIDLFRQVCSGVQHAHQKGVMHRDLKPSNVLVTVQDGKPKPKIIDFGLAKAVNHSFATGTIVTEAGQVIGTPEYMSPEQAGSDGLDVDTRTDVYSLGVVLYQLLAGELPFTKRELHSAGMHEMRRIIQETDPPRPSTRVTTMGDAATQLALLRGMEPAQLGRVLRGDLDWVVMKALEKDRTRRYETPLELAADLERYVRSEPVLAARPSAWYRTSKFVRRNRLQVTAGALVAAATIAGAVIAVLGLLEARASEEKLSEKVREFDQLAAIGMVARARDSELALGPAWPANVPEYESWLRDERKLLTELRPLLQRTLRTAEGRAAELAGDREELDQRLAREAQDFLATSIKGVLGDLDALEATGKLVEEDLAWAGQLQSATTSHPDGRRWEEAARAVAAADDVVASKLYKKVPIQLTPQPGLVPIGMNPVTKLWEFYDLRSAFDPKRHRDARDVRVPKHGADGGITVADETGVVFVLIPGGTLWMGADVEDSIAMGHEKPQHDVDLEPYLLARHELTRAQWCRLSRQLDLPKENRHGRIDAAPFFYEIGLLIPGSTAAVGGAHPAESLSWNSVSHVLRRAGMIIPTEAQWEWGCRGGSDTRWWCGDDVSSLEGVANGLDKNAKAQLDYTGEEVPWDDGWSLAAPVGSFKANQFGLYDVHGNVSEWCSDEFNPDYSKETPRAGDGMRTIGDGSGLKPSRGGSFGDAVRLLRCTSRGSSLPNTSSKALGVRPARKLLP